MKNKERERKREREREVRIIERFSWMENNLWGHLCIIITLRVEKYTAECVCRESVVLQFLGI